MHILSNSRRGSALVEFVFTFPLLFFSMLGAVDMGFYCYALIAVQDAARTVALYASSPAGNGNLNGACSLLLTNLSSLPNLSGVTTCNTLPLALTVTPITDGNGQAAQVTVSYKTVQLFPIYTLPGQLTITRTVTARSRS